MTKTQREYFTEIKEIVEREGRTDLVEFVEGRLAQLAKKASTPKKPTERQKENVALKADIENHLMQVAESKCIKELVSEVASLNGLTNQRVSHLLTDPVNAGVLEKNYVKKVPYFSIKM